MNPLVLSFIHTTNLSLDNEATTKLPTGTGTISWGCEFL